MRAKPANQRRSRDKRDRILNAMDRLLAGKPFAEISIGELAAAAQVSPATIYQRFSNVDATASVLLELYYRRVEAWAAERGPSDDIAAAPLFDALEAIAGNAWDQVIELGHVMRPAYLYSRQHPERVGPDWARLEQVGREGFAAFLEQHRRELAVDDVAQAATLVCAMFNLMLLAPLLHGDAAGDTGHPLRSRDAYANSVATLAHGYLTTGRRPGP